MRYLDIHQSSSTFECEKLNQFLFVQPLFNLNSLSIMARLLETLSVSSRGSESQMIPDPISHWTRVVVEPPVILPSTASRFQTNGAGISCVANGSDHRDSGILVGIEIVVRPFQLHLGFVDPIASRRIPGLGVTDGPFPFGIFLRLLVISGYVFPPLKSNAAKSGR